MRNVLFLCAFSGMTGARRLRPSNAPRFLSKSMGQEERILSSTGQTKRLHIEQRMTAKMSEGVIVSIIGVVSSVIVMIIGTVLGVILKRRCRAKDTSNSGGGNKSGKSIFELFWF